MKSNHIKHKQVETQEYYGSAQPLELAASCPINTNLNSQEAFQQRECVTPLTFSQKLTQSNTIVTAKNIEQTKIDNALEQLKSLLYELVYLGEGS